MWVGVPGFEPEASCAQARRVIFLKSFLAPLFLKTKDLAKNLVGGAKYENVARHPHC